MPPAGAACRSAASSGASAGFHHQPSARRSTPLAEVESTRRLRPLALGLASWPRRPRTVTAASSSARWKRRQSASLRSEAASGRRRRRSCRRPRRWRGRGCARGRSPRKRSAPRNCRQDHLPDVRHRPTIARTVAHDLTLSLSPPDRRHRRGASHIRPGAAQPEKERDMADAPRRTADPTKASRPRRRREALDAQSPLRPGNGAGRTRPLLLGRRDTRRICARRRSGSLESKNGKC